MVVLPLISGKSSPIIEIIMPWLFMLFVVLPIAEMALLIQVGSSIGVLNTVGLVLLTAVIGGLLLRQQGLATLLKANQRVAGGELPGREIAEGMALAAGGALLLTPGFITDGVGFTLLLPLSRRWLIDKAIHSGLVKVQGSFHAESTAHYQADTEYHTSERQGNVTIEGEFRRED